MKQPMIRGARAVVAVFALAGLVLGGCLQVQPQPPLPPATMSSWGPLGGFTMTSGAACAGQTTLDGLGSATVSDPCFTGADNIVMCTDTTAANAVRCAPRPGALSISGGAGDTISYVRLR